MQETLPSVTKHIHDAFTKKNPLFEKVKLFSVAYLNTKETTVLQVKIK